MSDNTGLVRWFVPGRIEVLGKHTDYAGGRSLLAAVDRGVTVTARLADDQDCDLIGRSDASTDEVRLRRGAAPVLRDGSGVADGHWGHYLQTVLDRLSENFGPLAPSLVEISSTLPLASGMSSSSALITGVALALADLHHVTEHPAWVENITSPIDLAGYAACIENGMSFGTLAGHRGVGTFGGSEDHTGMLCTSAGQLGQFSFCPIREEAAVPFPDDLSFVVAVSGVAAEKTGAARDLYNRASLSTREIVGRWNNHTGRSDAVLADAVASSDDAAATLRDLVAGHDYLSKRLNQFLIESYEIVPQASQALTEGDLDRFGELVDRSQALTTTDLGNQVPETIELARLARISGALAASAFGAGFGGSVWALVPTDQAQSFAENWLADYRASFPEVGPTSSVLVTRPGTPARRI